MSWFFIQKRVRQDHMVLTATKPVDIVTTYTSVFAQMAYALLDVKLAIMDHCVNQVDREINKDIKTVDKTLTQ